MAVPSSRATVVNEKRKVMGATVSKTQYDAPYPPRAVAPSRVSFTCFVSDDFRIPFLPNLVYRYVKGRPKPIHIIELEWWKFRFGVLF